jgi:hypothetical protein
MTPDDPGAARSAAAAEVTFWPRVAGQIARDAPGDERYETGFLIASVRHVAAAWAAAVTDGAGQRADAVLAAVARPEAVRILLHPRRAGGSRARLVARHLRITGIAISSVIPGFDPPHLLTEVTWTGRRSVQDRATGAVLAGDPGAAGEWTETWTLRRDGPAPWPWRLEYGYTQSAADRAGYAFISREESPAEYATRTGARWPADAPPGRWFRIQADFAEHDEKIGGHEVIVVERDEPPDRAEAERLAWPLMEAYVVSRVGPGQWWISVNTLEVRELLAG